MLTWPEKQEEVKNRDVPTLAPDKIEECVITLIEWRLANLPTTQRVDAKTHRIPEERSAAMSPVCADRERNKRTAAASINRRYRDPFRSRQRPGRLVQQLSSCMHRTGPGNTWCRARSVGIAAPPLHPVRSLPSAPCHGEPPTKHVAPGT